MCHTSLGRKGVSELTKAIEKQSKAKNIELMPNWQFSGDVARYTKSKLNSFSLSSVP